MAGPGNTVIDGAPGQAAPRTGAFPPDRAIAGRWRLAAHRRCLWLAAALLVLAAPVVQAAVREEACNRPLPADTGPTATAIVRTACLEHKAWFQPFIDGNGRLASLEVTEAERARLADDTPAWQRVARYWRESGTLSSMLHIAGAHSCLFPGGGREADNDCRAYLVDNPWSAAFVSWVMARAPVPGFRGSPRHADYIARAWNDPEGSPYAFADPYTNRAVPGDLLCHLRDHEVLGPEGLRQALDSPWRRMPQRSHCDIVVAVDDDDGNGPRMLYVVGGNVLNAVTMRMLPLDADGRLAPGQVGLALPVVAPADPPPEAKPPGKSRRKDRVDRRARQPQAASRSRRDTATVAGTPAPAAGVAAESSFAEGVTGTGTMHAGDPEAAPPGNCGPGDPAACSFNRRDWVVLLKLKPQAQLGTPYVAPLVTVPAAAAEATTPVPAPDSNQNQNQNPARPWW